jgi:hypothetical protein
VGTRKSAHNTKTKENLMTSAFRFFLKKTRKRKRRDTTNVLLAEIIEFYVEFEDLFKSVLGMICALDIAKIERQFKMKRLVAGQPCDHESLCD